MHTPKLGLLLVAFLATFLIAPISASADSGRLHAHLDVGFGVSLLGQTGPDGYPHPHGDDSIGGGGGWLSLDYQLAPPIAIEIIGGYAGFGRPFHQSGQTGVEFGQLGIGVRLRLLDDDAGYSDEANGNLASNLWISAHIGYAIFDRDQFAVDAAIGYELSITRPLQIGVFARTVVMFGGSHSGTDMILVGGITVGLELLGTGVAHDSDGDGLSDEREAELGTDPYDDDTDGDLISDGMEDSTGTDPMEVDSDNDGLNDGREDANQNGVLDPGETDPRRADTDGGGMLDPDEVRTRGQDPQFAGDDDSDEDGVPNNLDDCPGSPEGEQVTALGCPIVPESFTLEGVQFRSGSADILPSSEPTLNEALETLRRIPLARFEVGGHTDSQGSSSSNQSLSERRARSVRRWLIERGLDETRFEVRGYGEDVPIDNNETEEGRARNRRIEFRRL